MLFLAFGTLTRQSVNHLDLTGLGCCFWGTDSCKFRSAGTPAPCHVRSQEAGFSVVFIEINKPVLKFTWKFKGPG